jgi:hypothetical protein
MERPCLPQQLHQLKRCVRSGLCAINVDWPGIAGTLFAAMRQVWLVRYIRIGMTDSCPGWILNQQYVSKLSSKAMLVIPVVETVRSSTTSIE